MNNPKISIIIQTCHKTQTKQLKSFLISKGNIPRIIIPSGGVYLVQEKVKNTALRKYSQYRGSFNQFTKPEGPENVFTKKQKENKSRRQYSIGSNLAPCEKNLK